tara:strand:+ start:56 stop:730 length:675 start_codon:yes stop_codon:yes gene_type:complete
MQFNGKRLGEILLEGDVLTKRQLNKALAMQETGDKRKLGEILVDLGYITVEDITDIMMEQASNAKQEVEKGKRDLILQKQIFKGKIKPKSTPSKPTPPATPKPAAKKEPVEISEEKVLGTKFTLSIQTMIAAGTGLASLIGMWYALQSDIQEAKELPNLESLYSAEYPSRPEGYNWPRSYEQYKDQVGTLQDDMDEVFELLEELDEKIEELEKEVTELRIKVGK